MFPVPDKEKKCYRSAFVFCFFLLLFFGGKGGAELYFIFFLLPMKGILRNNELIVQIKYK